MENDSYKKLQKQIGYKFNDIEILYRALRHSSYVNEKGLERTESNERLEFLGDSVLGMITAQILFNRKPVMTEGEMTKLRSQSVCETALCRQANKLYLGDYINLGRGERSGGGDKRPSILADAFEALVAAIYIDGGMKAAVKFVRKTLGPELEKPAVRDTDFKSRLQEYIQTKPGMTHVYTLVSQDGPDHDKTFTVEVKINGIPKGTGTGKTKKSAEQSAAKAAIKALKN